MHCTIIAFPGNNCETETLRAIRRNGFEGEIARWNQVEKIGHSEVYVLPGGFSFEDRGRSGFIAARDNIFEALRLEAKKGKLILGICNGAQMIIESGLIPIQGNSTPLALAHNIRRSKTGKVLGTGFYNEWAHLSVERKDTAFTQGVTKILKIPFAHGEGRFTSVDPKVIETLKNGSSVAFRYSDSQGTVSENFPVTPNGSEFATAAVVNTEGTIMAIMPHPERFFEAFDGDEIFQSMRSWIEQGKSPNVVKIGDFHKTPFPKIKKLNFKKENLYLEKSLIITDNEKFSVQRCAEKILGQKIDLSRTILFEISGPDLERSHLNIKKLFDSGLLANLNKEKLFKTHLFQTEKKQKFLVKSFQSDKAIALSRHLTEYLQTPVTVHIYTAWDFGGTKRAFVETLLREGLLANLNAAEIFKTA